MNYRVQLLAQWPRHFVTLAGAIKYIREKAGLWYILEQKCGPKWETLVGRDESKHGFCEEGVEDRV